VGLKLVIADSQDLVGAEHAGIPTDFLVKNKAINNMNNSDNECCDWCAI